MLVTSKSRSAILILTIALVCFVAPSAFCGGPFNGTYVLEKSSGTITINDPKGPYTVGGPIHLTLKQNGNTVNGSWWQGDEYGSFKAKEVNWRIKGSSTCILKGKGRRKTKKQGVFYFDLGAGHAGSSVGGKWRAYKKKVFGKRVKQRGGPLKIEIIPNKPKRKVIHINTR